MIETAWLYKEGRKMNRKLVSGIMLMLLFGVLTLGFNVQLIGAESRTWYVDDDGPADFHTIQEAIHAATSGDTIIVYAGIYIETVNVNKRLTIKGIDYPVIDGNGSRSTVTIAADIVTLQGFNVTNCGYSGEPFGGGIELSGVENCIITENSVYNNKRNGISLTNSNGNTLENNTCVNNENGIRLWSQSPKTSSNNVIYNNTCFRNLHYGILLWSYVYMTTTTNNNSITKNNCSSNQWGGIYIGKSINSTLSENTCSHNGDKGIFLDGRSTTIKNITVTNNIVSNNSRGIYLWGPGLKVITIVGNTIESNNYGVYCHTAYGNEFYHNNFIDNTQQVHIPMSGYANVWDNGYPSGGNYWSDYEERYPYAEELDDSGIWDTPYVIDENNQDNYPLMNPWGAPPPSGTIYIRPDGSIDPPCTPIHRDGDLYTLTSNITSDADGIVIERDNMTLDGAGYTLQGTGGYSKGIDLSYRSNVSIKNVEIRAFGTGIGLIFSSNNVICENNCVANTASGIGLFGSSNNTISQNNVVANKEGIEIVKSSYNNTVSGNNVALNEGWGIDLLTSNTTISGNNIEGNKYGIYHATGSNIISGNNIKANEYGIYVRRMWDCAVYHNNFMDNTQQVYLYYPWYTSFWDDGYPSGGNYWSDYEETYPAADEIDSSGIWNIPYWINENNQDNYPLMNPWSVPTSLVTWEMVNEQDNRVTPGDEVYYSIHVNNNKFSTMENVRVSLTASSGAPIGIRVDGLSYSNSYSQDYGDIAPGSSKVLSWCTQVWKTTLLPYYPGEDVPRSAILNPVPIGDLTLSINVEWDDAEGTYQLSEDLPIKIEWPDFGPPPTGKEQYVEGSAYYNPDNAIVKQASAKAMCLAGSAADSPELAVRAVYYWVIKYFKPSPFHRKPIERWDDLAILLNMELGRDCGMCMQISEITVSLLRSLKIPARVVVGELNALIVPVGHQWLEAYVADSWIHVDPAMGFYDEEKPFDSYVNLWWCTSVKAATCVVRDCLHYDALRKPWLPPILGGCPNYETNWEDVSAKYSPHLPKAGGTLILLSEEEHFQYMDVCDNLGRHVKIDYETNQVITEIPDAYYIIDYTFSIILLPTDVSSCSIIIDSRYAELPIETYDITVSLVENSEIMTSITFTGTIVRGAIHAYMAEIEAGVLTVEPDPISELEDFKDFIGELSDDCFDQSIRRAPHLQKALFNKIEEIILKIEAGNYTDAINKLFHDIRAKMDGDSTAEDWIIDPEMQASLCVIIDHIISSIEILQPHPD